MDDPRDPRLELARRLLRRERVAPRLAGPSGAGGTDRSRPTWNLPRGDIGQVLVLADDGDGHAVPRFVDPPDIGATGGARYLYYAEPDFEQPFWLIYEGVVLEWSA